MLFAYPTGAVGNAVSKGVNELVIPNYKQTWGDIRRLTSAPDAVRKLSFKSQDYRLRSKLRDAAVLRRGRHVRAERKRGSPGSGRLWFTPQCRRRRS